MIGIERNKTPGKTVWIFTMVAALLVLYLNGYCQQRPHFTQYITNELIINPAYAGGDGALSVAFVHRSQWSGMEGSPSTQTFTAHSLVKSKNLGLGVSMIADQIGIHKSLLGHFSSAYRIELDEDAYFSFGLQFGFNNRRSDFSSLSGQVQSINDPTLFSANLSETSFEFGSGIYFKSKRMNLGLSIPNMLRDQSISDSLEFSITNNNIYFTGRYKIPLSTNLTLQPSVLFRYLQGVPLSYDINLAGIINEVLLIGVSYRSQESINTVIQANITPQLKIGYAYDFPLSNENTFSGNSHEFMLSYLFSFSRKKVAKSRE